MVSLVAARLLPTELWSICWHMLVNVGKYLDGASKVKLKVYPRFQDLHLALNMATMSTTADKNLHYHYILKTALTHSLTHSLSLPLSLSVCIYICIYIYKYIYVHACVICICIYIYIHMHACVCVCLCMWNVWTDLKPSRAAYIIINILSQGITGVPGGSVINADTSPGPV